MDTETGEMQGTLAEMLEVFPPLVLFGDGSTTVGRIIRHPESQPSLRADLATPMDWRETDITKEHQDDLPEPGTVQGAVKTWALEEFEGVVFDHGTLELADFVAVRKEPKLEVDLLHCKSSSEAKPGARVDDLYDLIGQSVRSAIWLMDPGAFWRYLKNRLNRTTGRSEILDGLSTDEIENWIAEGSPFDLHVWAFQPGLDVARAGTQERVTQLLQSGDSTLRAAGASFHVRGS
jgi:hypothetical protein